MRMIVLLAGVAAAVLVAVVVLGRGAAADEEPPWAQRASAACERGLAEARRLVERSASLPPQRRVIAEYGGATRIETGVIAELRALPRPRQDAAEIAAVLAVLDRSHAADVTAVARLERRFDETLLERRVNDTVAVAADLRARFIELGADGCARYYNPESYG
jgi:hypothetical protein